MMTGLAPENDFTKHLKSVKLRSTPTNPRGSVKDTLKAFEKQDDNSAVKSNSFSKNEDDDNIPEFLKHRLKSPAERKAELDKNRKNSTSKPPIDKPSPGKPLSINTPPLNKPTAPVKPNISKKPIAKERIDNFENNRTDTNESKDSNILHKNKDQNTFSNDKNNNLHKIKHIVDDIEHHHVEETKHSPPRLSRESRNTSVSDSRRFFEHMSQKSECDAVEPIKPLKPIKPVRVEKKEKVLQTPNEIHENEVIKRQKESDKNNLSNFQNNVPNASVSSTENLISSPENTDDDYYDDVNCVISSGEPNTNYRPEQAIQEDYYDDVADLPIHHQTPTSQNDFNHFSQNHSLTHTVLQNNIVTEDTYDDVANSDKTQKHDNKSGLQNAEIMQEDYYDDVQPELLQDNHKEQTKGQTLIQEDTYDDVAASLPEAPSKPLTTFSNLSKDRFNIPLGLQAWLDNILRQNKHRLKNVVNGVPQTAPTFERASKPEFKPSVKETEENGLIVDDVYDELDSEINYPPSTASTIATSKKKKDDGKIFKKQEKLEKEKKEREDKKKKKELKRFNLNANKPIVFKGIVVCKTDFKSKTKLDLSYAIGDELNLIDTSDIKCPDGKQLVQSMDGKFGYILKEEFGLADSTPDEEPALIPTEDEQEDYDVIDNPPPIPITPRPNLLPVESISQRPPVLPPSIPSPFISPSSPDMSHLPTEENYDEVAQGVQQEDFYDDINDQVPAEEIYEEVAT